MPRETATKGRSPEITVQTVFATLTIIGAVLIATNKLTSHRPNAPPGRSNVELSEQLVDLRLWEDPFSPFSDHSFTNRLGHVEREIKTEGNNCQILAVMIPGSPASEVRETRIRSRFAVVSALDRAGFSPRNEGQIGVAQIPWHSQYSLSTQPPTSPGSNSSAYERTNDFAFEWFQYEPHAFVDRAGFNNSTNPVLLLWLDEDAFNHRPSTRLGIFLTNLIPNNLPPVAIIGPYFSGTLNDMLDEISKNHSPQQSLSNILRNTSLYLATPSAIDHVLIETTTETSSPRGQSVIGLLTNWFSTVSNFAFTDGELAQSILSELELRGITFSSVNTNDNIVLLADWDTFYGRKWWAAFASALLVKEGLATDVERALDNFKKRSFRSSRLHSFYYLSGLDGRMLSEQQSEKRDEGEAPDSSDHGKPGRIRLLPESNRAEGPTQLDYLARLGESMEALHERLESKDTELSAIVIVGGDVYDTLLILQELRPRFPHTVFVTTTLDARLWDARELDWTRGLVVVSGYGLELTTKFQGKNPPFRDSLQTAQYAATLAALGYSNIANWTNTEPQRFEIGWHGAIPLPEVKAQGTNNPSLPIRVAEPPKRALSWIALSWRNPLKIIIGMVSVIGIPLLLSRHFRWITFQRSRFFTEPLLLTREDVGGWNGLLALASQLELKEENPHNVLHEYLYKKLIEISREMDEANYRPPQLRILPLFRRLQGGELTPEDAESEFMSDPDKLAWIELALDKFLMAWNQRIITDTSRTEKREADERLSELIPLDSKKPPAEEKFNRNWAAFAARKVGWKLSDLRERGFKWCLTVAAIFAIAALLLMWKTPYTEGYPDVFFSGTSVWPTIWLCFLAMGLSAIFLAISFFHVRAGVLKTTRKWGLWCGEPDVGSLWRKIWPDYPSSGVVRANEIWAKYVHSTRFGRWFGRAVIWASVYFIFICTVTRLVLGSSRVPLVREPARGPYVIIAWLAFFSVVCLSFWAIDAAVQCSRFVYALTCGPTIYPEATLEHFSERSAKLPVDMLSDWIDVHIVAVVTGHLARLIYFPVIGIFVFLLAYSKAFFAWPWVWQAYVLTGLNVIAAAASVLILQHAAISARDRSRKNLEEMLSRMKGLRATTAKEREQRRQEQVEQLLADVCGMDEGIFAGFWANPVLGAFLIPPAGFELIELIRYLTK